MEQSWVNSLTFSKNRSYIWFSLVSESSFQFSQYVYFHEIELYPLDMWINNEPLILQGQSFTRLPVQAHGILSFCF